MKQKNTAAFVFVLFFIFCSLSLRGDGDWKKDVGHFFKKAHEFHNIAKYLEENLADVPDREKPAAIIILCYTYKKLENTVNEEKWLNRYFEKYQAGSPDFPFLSRTERVRVFEYIERWHRKYPKLKGLRIAENSTRLPYFDPPAVFILTMEMNAPAEITITNHRKETIYSGYVNQGTNTIEIPFQSDFQKRAKNRLDTRLKTGSIEIENTVTLVSQCDYPGHMEFNREDGRVSVKGESFKEEQTTEVTVETKRYFDKKYFMKKAVVCIALGSAVYLFNRTVIHNQLNREDASPDSKALMNGINKSANVVTIGLSLKGILHIVKSFKRKEVKKEKTVHHKGAAAHNELLRRLILEARKKIFINYQLKRSANHETREIHEIKEKTGGSKL